jgi:hypothetical protein
LVFDCLHTRATVCVVVYNYHAVCEVVDFEGLKCPLHYFTFTNGSLRNKSLVVGYIEVETFIR